QLRDIWAAFQDSRLGGFLGVRSIWPSIVEPNVLLVQLLQVRFRFAGNARPSACEPVMASCQLGVMPTPAIMLPRSVSAVCWLRLLLALCRSSTSLAITTPLEFCHGPLPMRSRALTGPPWASAVLLRYACQVLPPAPTVVANCWQWASAPARPPRSPPLPGPA